MNFDHSLSSPQIMMTLDTFMSHRKSSLISSLISHISMFIFLITRGIGKNREKDENPQLSRLKGRQKETPISVREN